jgi:hypothetical protein
LKKDKTEEIEKEEEAVETTEEEIVEVSAEDTLKQ